MMTNGSCRQMLVRKERLHRLKGNFDKQGKENNEREEYDETKEKNTPTGMRTTPRMGEQHEWKSNTTKVMRTTPQKEGKQHRERENNTTNGKTTRRK